MDSSENNQIQKNKKIKKVKVNTLLRSDVNNLCEVEPLPMKDKIEDDIEKRISQWLDENNVIQVNPSEKQYEYYRERKMGLLNAKQSATSPSKESVSPKKNDEVISSPLKHPSLGGLSLCRNNLLSNRKSRNITLYATQEVR